jgi:hypothetical protein
VFVDQISHLTQNDRMLKHEKLSTATFNQAESISHVDTFAAQAPKNYWIGITLALFARRVA